MNHVLLGKLIQRAPELVAARKSLVTLLTALVSSAYLLQYEATRESARRTLLECGIVTQKEPMVATLIAEFGGDLMFAIGPRLMKAPHAIVAYQIFMEGFTSVAEPEQPATSASTVN